MPKGFFSQGVVVLAERPISLDEIARALADWEIVKRVDKFDSWPMGGPTLIVAYRKECRGYVSVDVVDKPWPDSMGDPKTDPQVFAAWSMGHFGPYAFPGGLERAAEQCWGWDDAKEAVAKHKAFVRLRVSYAFGAKDDDPIMPDGIEPSDEIEFLLQMVLAILKLPGTLCYYNPNGEAVRDRDSLVESIDSGHEQDIVPIDVIANVRIIPLTEDWCAMDTVGNSQLDVRDMEACFHGESYDPSEVDHFMKNATLYVLANGEIVKDGDTMDGPGDVRWQAIKWDDSLFEPPRRTLRWVPLDKREIPPEVEGGGGE